MLNALVVVAAFAIVTGCGSDAESPTPPSNAVSLDPNYQSQQPIIENKVEQVLPAVNASAAPRYLIVHADDAGLCDEANRATIEAMEQGIVSSASVMVPCRGFADFAAYAKEHPERDFGVHLTLNAEYPTYRWKPVLPAREVPGLVDDAGYFWQTEEQTVGNARADEVERELTAQIERALQFGIPVSHLDTHMGTVFRRLDFFEVYVNLGIKYKLPVLISREMRYMPDFATPSGYKKRSGQVIEALTQNELPVLDALFMHYAFDSPQQKKDWYFTLFRRLRPGVSELIVHCGYRGGELQGITGSAILRDGDRRFLIDPATSKEIQRQGIKVINWKQFREMASKAAIDNSNRDNASNKERQNS